MHMYTFLLISSQLTIINNYKQAQDITIPQNLNKNFIKTKMKYHGNHLR